jgi:hypothetical protein
MELSDLEIYNAVVPLYLCKGPGGRCYPVYTVSGKFSDHESKMNAVTIGLIFYSVGEAIRQARVPHVWHVSTLLGCPCPNIDRLLDISFR